MPAILFILLLLLPTTAAAADVYKCKGRSGETMYSEHPCDARAEPMKLRDTRPSESFTAAATAAAESSQARNTETPASADSSGGELEAIRAAEKSCIADATASIYGPSNDRVGTLQQQMSLLNEELAKANDAERSQALRTRMATFRQAITREHNNAHTQMGNARRRCIELAKTSDR
ncbi:DUF4124 domain-containing protein [Stenotrophomonas sp.]|uniref:DUF4124 domain-containing protein n=1 Tax=Stenotrophomonas sp. TaxID=69392 RepID=UPI0028A96C04|nr:DUF4124 domain-containing protein [Stenotrophomonas sp.]